MKYPQMQELSQKRKGRTKIIMGSGEATYKVMKQRTGTLESRKQENPSNADPKMSLNFQRM